MQEADGDGRTYRVVINHEEQYSIWLADRDIPAGWRDGGKTGTKEECLAHVGEVWTDMRPLSLRKQMEGLAPAPVPPAPSGPRSPDGMNDLVARLANPQPVEAGLRPERTPRVLREQLDRGYVFMRFTGTGTEVGIRLDRAASDWTDVDFERGTGKAKVVGELTLNYNRVRYHGDIDLVTLSGTGRLEFVEAVRPART